MILANIKVERIGQGEFTAEIHVSEDGQELLTRTFTYQRSNFYYAAYKAIIFVLNHLEDDTVRIETNMHAFIEEVLYDDKEPRTMTRVIRDRLAERNITLVA